VKPPFVRWPDDDSGTYLVLDADGFMVAGPYREAVEADAWITKQHELLRGIDE